MQIEQLPPNKPNFKLILVLSCFALLVILIVAYFMVDWDGKRLVPHRARTTATSQYTPPMQTIERT